MLCNNCGYQITGSARFCPHCGYDLSLESTIKNKQQIVGDQERTIEKSFKEIFDMPGDFGKKVVLIGQQPIDEQTFTALNGYLKSDQGKALLLYYNKNIYKESVIVTTKGIIWNYLSDHVVISYDNIKCIDYDKPLFADFMEVVFYDGGYIKVGLPVGLGDTRKFVRYMQEFLALIQPLFQKPILASPTSVKKPEEVHITYRQMTVNSGVYKRFSEVFSKTRYKDLIFFEKIACSDDIQVKIKKYLVEESEYLLMMLSNEYSNFLLTDKYLSWESSRGFIRVELGKIDSVYYKRIVLAPAMIIVDTRGRTFELLLTGLGNGKEDAESFVMQFKQFVEQTRSSDLSGLAQIKKINKISCYDLWCACGRDPALYTKDNVDRALNDCRVTAEIYYKMPKGEKAVFAITATSFWDDVYSKGFASCESGMYYVSENYGLGYMSWDEFKCAPIKKDGDRLFISDVEFRHIKNIATVFSSLEQIKNIIALHDNR